jgi:hypothetical protein
LPYEVANAVSGDTIAFALSPPCSTIVLVGTIDIDADLTIEGPGADTLAVSGGNAVGVFAVGTGATVTIAGLTVDDGKAVAGGGIANDGGSVILGSSTLSGNTATDGGGILNLGTLTVNDSTVSGNAAVSGGGIDNQGALTTIVDSTVAQNTASDGGGIYDEGGRLTLTSSTLSGNTAPSRSTPEGVGIFNDNGAVSVAATILADNGPASGCDSTGSGGISDAGYNVDDDSCGFPDATGSQVDVDPDLGPLEDNGGPTQTMSPLLTSPVLNRIPAGAVGNGTALCPGTDQRGVARPQGDECDIGAVELVLPDRGFTGPDSATAMVGSRFSFTVTTQGSPKPSIKKTGKLPAHLIFVSNHNGTATISGTPAQTGVCNLTITATFGKGRAKSVVSQPFTLTVDPG